MSHATRLLFLVLASCIGSAEVVDAYEATVDEMQALVDDHASAVGEADTLDAVGALEADYQTRWDVLLAEMDDEMGRMDGCTMAGSGRHPPRMGMMEDALATMGEVRDAVADHMAQHDTHPDVRDCRAEEDVHQDAMAGRFDVMHRYPQEWRDFGMACPGQGR